MRAARLVASLVLVAAAIVPSGSSTAAERAAEHTSVTSQPDSVPGVPITCTDFRTSQPIESFAQHLLASGLVDAAWEPGAGLSCVGALQQVSHVTIRDAAGGAIVAWVDTRDDGGDIYAQRLRPDGQPADGWPPYGTAVCTAPGSQYQLTGVGDGADGAILAWADFRSGRAELYAQRLGSAGQALWDPNGRRVAESASEQQGPVLVSDEQGGATLIWQATGAGVALLAAHLDAQGEGAATAASAHAVASGAGTRALTAAVRGGADQIFVVWEDTRTGDSDIYLTALAAGGATCAGWPAGGVALGAGPGDQSRPVVTPSDSGGVIVAWVHAGNIMARRVNASGVPAWSQAVSLCEATNEQYAPAIISDGVGGAIVAWEDYREGENADVYAQRVSAAGVVQWSADGVALCRRSGHQFGVSLRPDGGGGALSTWIDGASQVRASLLRARPPSSQWVPRVKLVESGAGRARVVWATDASDRRLLDLLRKLDGAAWAPIAQLSTDANGDLAYEDRDVLPGSHVEYRLAEQFGDQQVVYEAVSVEIPLPQPLAIRFLRTEPDGRTLIAGVMLETHADAGVEVLDVQGRRLLRRSLASPGAGEHVLRIPLARALAPSIYFVRLSQGSERRTQRMVVVR